MLHVAQAGTGFTKWHTFIEWNGKFLFSSGVGAFGSLPPSPDLPASAWYCIDPQILIHKSLHLITRRRWMRPLPSVTKFHMKRNPIDRMHTRKCERKTDGEAKPKWLQICNIKMAVECLNRLPDNRRRHGTRQHLGIAHFEDDRKMLLGLPTGWRNGTRLQYHHFTPQFMWPAEWNSIDNLESVHSQSQRKL